MKKGAFHNWIVLFALILNVNKMNAQTKTNALDAQEQSIIAISALMATGDLESLKIQLNTGLDAGLTVNEIKEALIQLYAYCGFPRSLNGISAFMQILEERKTKGITDTMGKGATPLKDRTDKYERGRKTLETLTKLPQAKPAPGFGEFAPRIDAFLKEHLFADIFDSDVLDYQQRELVTISALAAMPGVELQLQSHINMGMNTCISAKQMKAIFDIIERVVGKERAETARAG
jgi:4-carboxymuconolactone decarboxylase